MARRVNLADQRDQETIRQAVRFSVHFRAGPRETFTEYAATLDAARAVKARMDAEHGGHGRRAMIYAIAADGTATPVA